MKILLLAILALGVPSCAFDADDEVEDGVDALDDFYGPYHVDDIRKPPRPYAMAAEAVDASVVDAD